MDISKAVPNTPTPAIFPRLWIAVKKLCSNLFAAFLFVWFISIGPLILIPLGCVVLAVNWLYQAFVSIPLRKFLRVSRRISQLRFEALGSSLQVPIIAQLSSSVDKLLWVVLNSEAADHVAVANLSIHVAFRHAGMRFQRLVEHLLVSVMFRLPLKTIYVAFAALFMLGGGGALFIAYQYLWGVKESTYAEDQRHEQRLKLENNGCIYKPLRPGQIRILHLQAGKFGSPLLCELKTSELTTSKYECLSYVWGNPIMDREVRVNNERTWVTQNLYHALASLRYEKETRVLWVDAICINQVDNAEREAQVPQMRNIYGSANRVVVWLGTTPFGSKRAFEIAGKDNPPHYYHYGTVRLVSQLLSSPWWVRVWVVQELIVAKSVIVQCSETALEWDHFCRLVDTAIQSPCFSKVGTHIQEYHTLKSQRRSKSQYVLQGSLTDLLYTFRTRQATDKRDKIYALLGLLNIDESQREDTTLIQADYTTEPSTIFSDCAAKLINASRSLATVALAECVSDGQEPDKRPTWCPKWDELGNDFRAVPFWIGGQRDDEGRCPWIDSQFTAAGDITAPLCEVHSQRIKLSGWAADEIVTVGQKTDVSLFGLPDPFNLAEILAALDVRGDWMKAILNWEKIANIHDEEPTGPTVRAFYAVLTAGIYRTGRPDDAENEQFKKVMRAACFGRTFFITASGQFGLGPNSTAVGDKVFILLGSKVPVALRPLPALGYADTGVSHLYVGQAYVDTLMVYKGSIKEDIEWGRRSLEDVYLE